MGCRALQEYAWKGKKTVHDSKPATPGLLFQKSEQSTLSCKP